MTNSPVPGELVASYRKDAADFLLRADDAGRLAIKLTEAAGWIEALQRELAETREDIRLLTLDYGNECERAEAARRLALEALERARVDIDAISDAGNVNCDAAFERIDAAIRDIKGADSRAEVKP